MMSEYPTLTGSEKQIAWAEKIRKEKMESLDERFNGLGKNSPKNEKEEKMLADMEMHFINQISAAWWIDNRFMTSQDMCKIAAQALGLIK